MPAETPGRTARPGLLGGMLASWRGAGFMLAHPRLIPYALIPLAINAALYVLVFYLSNKYFGRWIDSLLPQAQVWYWAILYWFIRVLFFLVLLLAAGFTFVAVANIVASPFNDALSAEVEKIVTGLESGGPFSLAAIVKEIGRTVIEELKKIAFYLAALALILLLNLIPVVGQLAYMVCGALLTVIWLGLNFLDYPLARHGLRLGDKLNFIRGNFWPVLGYSLAVAAGVIIPLVNLAVFPSAVAGGTLLYLELEPKNR